MGNLRFLFSDNTETVEKITKDSLEYDYLLDKIEEEDLKEVIKKRYVHEYIEGYDDYDNLIFKHVTSRFNVLYTP